MKCVLVSLFSCVLPLIARAAEAPKYPAEYGFAIRRAVEAFHARDFGASLEHLEAAEKVVPPTAMTLNVRGAVAIERRDFEAGEKLCRQALEIDPKFFAARVNLGEIPFLQKRYSAAREVYEALLAEEPKNELLQYRVFLTYLLEGNEAAAEEAMKRIKFPGDTAAYYYAHAAWEFARKNEQEARGWVKSGDWVFSPAKNIYFSDVMYDLGWMKRER